MCGRSGGGSTKTVALVGVRVSESLEINIESASPPLTNGGARPPEPPLVIPR